MKTLHTAKNLFSAGSTNFILIMELLPSSNWVLSNVAIGSMECLSCRAISKMCNSTSKSREEAKYITVTSESRQSLVHGSWVIRGRRLAEHRVTDDFDSRSDLTAGEEEVTVHQFISFSTSFVFILQLNYKNLIKSVTQKPASAPASLPVLSYLRLTGRKQWEWIHILHLKHTVLLTMC